MTSEALIAEDGLDVHLAQPDGSWAPLDLEAAAEGIVVQDVAFGALGLAAVAWSDEDGGVSYVVHSSDGTSLSVVAIGDHVDPLGPVAGLTVTADAILVRVDSPSDDDPTTVPTQRVLVGTPR